MERLTMRNAKGEAVCARLFDMLEGRVAWNQELYYFLTDEAIEKLAAYEEAEDSGTIDAFLSHNE